MALNFVLILLSCLWAPSAVGSTMGPPWPWPLKVGGTRTSDYIFNVFRYDPTFASAQIIAGSSPSTGPGDYGAFFHQLDASNIRGHRVMLEARVTPFGVIGGAWAGLFVRVDSVDGRILAFDNMRRRPITGYRQDGATHAQVVVQVPGPQQGDDVCPEDPDSVAATVVVGMFLCGGKGVVRFDSAEFKQVAADHPLTADAGSWSGPGLNDLGPARNWRFPPFSSPMY